MPNQALLDSRYRILRTIGSGGMGVVYLVVDTSKENNIMALKTCTLANDVEAAEEFRSEFRSIRGVSHPHIPEVYDFGMLPDHNDSLYFTTEFIDGQPLDRLQPEWTPAQLREILVGLCRALAFLHSRSLLHRDIKPENVLGKLDESGAIALLKLVDFGLAADSKEQKGELSGTLDYLAPEVIRGGSHTGASDLYSLGLLLYRLATGKLPHDDQDAMAAAKLRAKSEIPSPLRYRPTLPVGLADVISTMVRLKEKDRPQSPRHVIALLNEREGTDYPYETDETSRAYIRSASLVTNREARQQLSMMKGTLQQGHNPRSIFFRSLPGMGRSSLVKEFQSELTLSGVSCRLVTKTSDLPTTLDCPRVVLVPDTDSIDTDKLCEIKQALGGREILWVLGGGKLPEACETSFGSFKILDLKPLDEEGVDEFIRTTFPERSFPDDFCSRLYSETLGIPSALQALLKSLQESGLLRIGLFGWELLPGDWSYDVHPDVSRYIDEIFTPSSSVVQTEMQLLSCSDVPLPGAVLHGALKQLCDAEDSTAVCLNEIRNRNDLIAEADGAYFIRYDAARACLAAGMDNERQSDPCTNCFTLFGKQSKGLIRSCGSVKFFIMISRVRAGRCRLMRQAESSRKLSIEVC